jgi:hypothetical protein
MLEGSLDEDDSDEIFYKHPQVQSNLMHRHVNPYADLLHLQANGTIDSEVLNQTEKAREFFSEFGVRTTRSLSGLLHGMVRS